MEKADEELARLLQAEEFFFLMQQTSEDGKQQFASKVEGYVSQVLQYEDPFRQSKARETLQIDYLEEKALVALAKEGKQNPCKEELEHNILFQLLLWFKTSFRWVNSTPCFLCGSDTDGIGMGKPTNEELQFGGNRVELFRCRKCRLITRFPRYNDPCKLLETRSGRCGEWANCFTLYCRSFGYQARLVLDFTDHLWTECYSNFLGRWVHLDPCEGVFDKPLLYENGWGKKLNYLIAFSKDGVFDVTKRYTRNWEEVRLRRNLTSEDNVAKVITSLTSQLRRNFTQEVLEQLFCRDAEETAEINSFQTEENEVLETLPGRKTGSKEWREARGELGSSRTPLDVSSPKRPCVDDFVSQVFLALGKFHALHMKGSLSMKVILEDLLCMLKELQDIPYKLRSDWTGLNTANPSSLRPKGVDVSILQHLYKALGLVKQDDYKDGFSSSSQSPVDTALALPVAIDNLKNVIDLAKIKGDSDSIVKHLSLFAKYQRISGAWAEASGEEPPFGIASSAFDGLPSTKWEDPNGAKGGWLMYQLSRESKAEIQCYEVISANDCPERDPKDWTLEGSNDSGTTWSVLDSQQSQIFSERFERKSFEIPLDKTMPCNAFRMQFLSVRDSSSQSRLQLSCVNFYTKKTDCIH